jgi:hypothetical protein
LRYAAALAGQEPDKLSPMAWSYLDRLFARRPDALDGFEGLVARLEDRSDAEGVAWGMPPLAVPRGRLLWHAAAAHLASGDLRRAHARFAEAARLGVDSPWFWADRAMERARAGNRAAALADLDRAAARRDAAGVARADARDAGLAALK